MVVEGQVGKKMFKVGCSIMLSSDMYFSNYFYYFKILYTRASNKNMSLIFFKEDIVLRLMVHGAWKLPALNLLPERKQKSHIHALSTSRPAIVSTSHMEPKHGKLSLWNSPFGMDCRLRDASQEDALGSDLCNKRESNGA